MPRSEVRAGGGYRTSSPIVFRICGTGTSSRISPCALLHALRRDDFQDFAASSLNLWAGSVDDLLNSETGDRIIRNELDRLPNFLPNLWDWHVDGFLRCALLHTLRRDVFDVIDDSFLDLWLGNVQNLLSAAIGCSVLRAELGSPPPLPLEPVPLCAVASALEVWLSRLRRLAPLPAERRSAIHSCGKGRVVSAISSRICETGTYPTCSAVCCCAASTIRSRICGTGMSTTCSPTKPGTLGCGKGWITSSVICSAVRCCTRSS